MRFIPPKLKAQQVIYLLGFMAAGKSYTGQALAQRLNYHFVDLDDYIQQKTDYTISQLFAHIGTADFRIIETFYLHQLVDNQPRPVVISLGGGTPCFGDNLAFIKKTGFSIFVNTPLALIFERLKLDKKNRPLLAHLDGDMQLLHFIQQLYLQRYRFYSQADLYW